MKVAVAPGKKQFADGAVSRWRPPCARPADPLLKNVYHTATSARYCRARRCGLPLRGYAPTHRLSSLPLSPVLPHEWQKGGGWGGGGSRNGEGRSPACRKGQGPACVVVCKQQWNPRKVGWELVVGCAVNHVRLNGNHERTAGRVGVVPRRAGMLAMAVGVGCARWREQESL